MSGVTSSAVDDDPARAFLDRTVPRADDWDGGTSGHGPARPRHVQHPVEPEPLPDPRERRRQGIRRAAWTFGPSAGYLAASATLDGAPGEGGEPREHDDPAAGYGEIGGGL